MMLSLAVKKLVCFMRSCIFILVLMPVLLDSLQKVRSRVNKFKHSPYFPFLQSQDITSCVAILDSCGIQFWSSEMWLSSLILLHVINWFDQHHLWKRLHFLHVRYWLLKKKNRSIYYRRVGLCVNPQFYSIDQWVNFYVNMLFPLQKLCCIT